MEDGDTKGSATWGGAHRAVTACVSENRPDWFRMVMLQAVSIRNLGGALASSPIRTYFVRGLVDPERGFLEEMGVEVIDVDPFPSPIPHANKLRMFEAHAQSGEGTLIALDSDIVVLGDLSTEINPNALRGLSGGYSPFDEKLWGAWLEERDLPRRPGSYYMHRVGRSLSVPYLCSGVLLVPKEFCGPLAESWAKQVLALVDRFDAPPGSDGLPALPPEGRFFTDQLALTCAILEADIPVDPLPVGCNFRPGLDNLGLLGIGHVSPLKAVHYHRWGLDQQLFISPAKFEPLNRDFERINTLTATHLGIEYHPQRPAGPLVDVERLKRAPAALRRRAKSAARRSAGALRQQARRGSQH